jgi:hypothetical protein
MVVGFEVSRFGTWDRVWGASNIRVVHGSLLNGIVTRNTEAGSVQDP